MDSYLSTIYYRFLILNNAIFVLSIFTTLVPRFVYLFEPNDILKRVSDWSFFAFIISGILTWFLPTHQQFNLWIGA